MKNKIQKILKPAQINDKKLNDLKKEAIDLVAEGQGYFDQKKYDLTIEQMDKILSREADFIHFSSYRTALRLTAHSYWRQYKLDKPAELFLSSVKWSNDNGETEEALKDLSNLGVLYYQRAEYPKSIEFTTQAYNRALEINSEKGIGFTLGNLGNCYYHLGNFKKSLEYQIRASEFAKKTNDEPFLSRILNTTSVLYKNLGDFKNAVKTALEAVKLKEKLNEPLGPIYLNIGAIYKETGNVKDAEKYYLKAQKILEKDNNKNSLAMVLNNLGNLYMDENKFDSALEYFNKALKIEEEIGDKKGKLTVLINIGLIYSDHIKNYSKAYDYFENALASAKEIESHDSILTVSLKYCGFLLSYEKSDQAEKLLDTCVKYFDEAGSYENKLDFLNCYVNLYKQTGDYAKALDFKEKHSILKDDIYSKENQKTISEMQTKYETEKKEKEAEFLRIKNEELAKKNIEIKHQKDKLEKTLNELNENKLKLNLIKEQTWKNINRRLIGESSKIKNIIELISVVAKSDRTNVLITGESGTGKEIAAQYIHELSGRSKNSFHAVNSSAIPDSLFESQFFGHEKNSFTGAASAHIGVFEFANKGTLFLDEIGTMPVDMQSKLLRVLEERKIMRLGSNKEIPIDIRLISATNMEMSDLLEKKFFREDLYHRLATFVIQMPPLRERKEDIPLLLEFFISIFNKQLGKQINKIESSVFEYLSGYNFPGNVRELRNMVERAVIVSDSSILKCSHFHIPGKQTANSEFKVVPLEQIEKEHIINVLRFVNYNQSKAAELLGVERRVVSRKMTKYGLGSKKNSN